MADLASWRVAVPGSTDVLAAIDTSSRWQVAFWDAMILVAARKMEAGIVWSEDLNEGQEFDGAVIRNPFR